METSSERKPRHHQDFTCIALAHLSPSTSFPSLPPTVTASFSVANSGDPQLRLHQPESVGDVLCFDLRTSQVQWPPISVECGVLLALLTFVYCMVFNLGPLETLVVVEEQENFEAQENSSFSKAFKLVFRTPDQRRAFDTEFEHWRHEVLPTQNGTLENGSIMSQSKFDNKIEVSSAKMYFHYYGQLLHQQNMLQDYVRTGTYFYAVIENCIDFQDRVVVDVGAGSGILSLFAAQAGAKHVYAVEASEMAEYASRLVAGNPSLGHRITVIRGKIEEVELPEKADILISEPMGTLLVNERMLETYVIARERFLIPNGKMFPSIGRIHMAPFSDEYLFVELANKALFWQQHNFYGVDLTPLYGSAFQGYFSQPVVDAFDPRLLVSPPIFHTLDFNSIKEEELYEIDIPLSFIASVGTKVHGLACWFDVLFDGSSVQRWLTTAPGSPTTHWYQMRCVLSQPIYVMAGQEITGRLHLVAHSAQSYTIYLTMSAKMLGAGANDQGGLVQTSTGKLELKEPYYRLSQAQPYMPAQDLQFPQQFQFINTQEGNVTNSISLQQPQNSGTVINR